MSQRCFPRLEERLLECSQVVLGQYGGSGAGDRGAAPGEPGAGGGEPAPGSLLTFEQEAVLHQDCAHYDLPPG